MKREPYVKKIDLTRRDAPWHGMTPVKRYEYFTLFYKRTANGDVYSECFLNIDLEGKIHE